VNPWGDGPPQENNSPWADGPPRDEPAPWMDNSSNGNDKPSLSQRLRNIAEGNGSNDNDDRQGPPLMLNPGKSRIRSLLLSKLAGTMGYKCRHKNKKICWLYSV